MEALRRRRAILLFSDETFDELRTRLSRPKFRRYVDLAEIGSFLADLEAISEWLSITGAKLGCRDANDDKFLETALNGSADCIVTGDHDLLVMSPFRGIPIVRANDLTDL